MTSSQLSASESPTALLYLADPSALSAEVEVLSVSPEGSEIVLNQTPFYPQGGGQPSDVGQIVGPDFRFEVSKASLVGETVVHAGQAIEGSPHAGIATATVDGDSRARNSRLHSGGHLVMAAVFEISGLRAMKGFHFPDGPYVEFEGAPEEEEREAFLAALERRLDEMVAEDQPITWDFESVDELRARGVFMPMEVPANKPTRVVSTYGYDSPCGGTHVSHGGELAGLRVRGIKVKKGNLRVSYEISDAT